MQQQEKNELVFKELKRSEFIKGVVKDYAAKKMVGTGE